VVDDDLRMVKTICDILKIEGFETLPTFTGEEAVYPLPRNQKFERHLAKQAECLFSYLTLRIKRTNDGSGLQDTRLSEHSTSKLDVPISCNLNLEFYSMGD
jgi:hypothetical protein